MNNEINENESERAKEKAKKKLKLKIHNNEYKMTHRVRATTCVRTLRTTIIVS